jgi:phosphatidylglycerophosphate synthase
MGQDDRTPAPATLFPLVRHLSWRLTPLLARLPLSANQITLLSLIAALGASYLYLLQGYRTNILAALLFVLAFVLDTCDG